MEYAIYEESVIMSRRVNCRYRNMHACMCILEIGGGGGGGGGSGVCVLGGGGVGSHQTSPIWGILRDCSVI